MVDNILLHMGFVPTPYTSATKVRPVISAEREEKRKKSRGFTGNMTADKVANILEGKYSIIETFQVVYEEDIKNIISDKFPEVIVNMIYEGKYSSATTKSIMKDSAKQIERLFKQFLDNEEMNGMMPGVPTKASLGKQRKRGKTNKQRASFEKSGIYRASFRCWADAR
jgi:hypothetical protein